MVKLRSAHEGMGMRLTGPKTCAIDYGGAHGAVAVWGYMVYNKINVHG